MELLRFLFLGFGARAGEDQKMRGLKNRGQKSIDQKKFSPEFHFFETIFLDIFEIKKEILKEKIFPQKQESQINRYKQALGVMKHEIC